MKMSEFSLNLNQQRAIEWDEGPLLVLAGPGSGKTLVLTLRAARILKKDPDASVLALTFTTKAADEMRERLDKLMGERADRAHLCTFHSFAADILRQHGSHVGIEPDFSLLTLDEDRIALLDMLLANTSVLPLNGDKPYSERLQSLFKNLQNNEALIPSDRRNVLVLLDRLFAESYNGESVAPSLIETPPWVPDLFEAYCRLLQESNRLDYGSLLHFAKKLLSENAGVARLTQMAWHFICVDEFQDTNRAQYDLLRLLVPTDRPNLFVVADDDQIIYQWNGASPERLRALRKNYGMKVIQLPENYRCPPFIIKLANNLISHNQTRSSDKQPLVAHKEEECSNQLIVLEYQSDDEEIAAIAGLIREMNWNTDECVVLARSTKLLQKVAQSLEANGLTPYLPQRKNEFECASVRWMHAALRLANARHDREYLRRMCVAWEAFTDNIIELESVEAASALNGGDFLRAWIAIASKGQIIDKHRDLLIRVRQDLADRLVFEELLGWFWDEEWLDDPLEKEEKRTWRELHNTLMYEHSPEKMTLHHYLQKMDLKPKVTPRERGSVPCLTVHGAKGLEFKRVFLIGMAEEEFPSYYATKKGPTSKEIEEERRSCFVAITRVQETLCISWAQRYNGYKKEPSRFLEEMGLRNSES
ncbi:MAG TPA: ATP-dependent helicase [Firmicutes bacterium]|nr:ATP-dependent helicase [Bacillota bacterium]